MASNSRSLTRKEAEYLTERNGKESLLLRLPAEIRGLIYEHAIGGHILVGRTTAQRRADERQRCNAAREDNDSNHLFRRLLSDYFHVKAPLVNAASDYALPMTCRQLRHETLLLVYTQNTLEFNSASEVDDTLERFPSLATTVAHVRLPYRLVKNICWLQRRDLPAHIQDRMMTRATTFNKFAGLKKVTLQKNNPGEELLPILSGRSIPREIRASDHEDALYALIFCIKRGLEVEVEMDHRREDIIELLDWGTVMGAGVDALS